MPSRKRDGDGDPLHYHYRRAFGVSTRNNALALGYSVAATGSFGVLTKLDPPSIADIFLFAAGACVVLGAVNVIVTRGFQQRAETEPRLVLATATSFSAISSTAAIALAALFGWQVGGWEAWLFGPLCATFGYLAVSAVEIAGARGAHQLAGNLERLEREDERGG
jgi:membrane-associated phospholipid phosphatase